MNILKAGISRRRTAAKVNADKSEQVIKEQDIQAKLARLAEAEQKYKGRFVVLGDRIYDIVNGRVLKKKVSRGGLGSLSSEERASVVATGVGAS